MNALPYWRTCVILAAGRLRRQLWLLVGLAVLCALLSLGAGRSAEHLLSQGVDFHGVTMAVAAPEGDDTAGLLERYMGGMEDIAQYGRVVAMEEDEALAALARGEVTAVLLLPERFIQGVMWGENPDLRLVVARDRPLESLLLFWVGQSGVDFLSAVQSGIYAVLDLYEQNPPPGLDRHTAMVEINLRYITLTLDRANQFRLREISATGALPIFRHYGLSLLAYFGLSAAPLFMPLYTGDWIGFQRRLRCAGQGCAPALFGAVAVGSGALLLFFAPSVLFLGGGHPLALLGGAGLMAIYCSLFSALCCLLTQSASGCGGIAFTVSLLSLFLAGGVIPPVLLPAAVQRISGLSPVTWLRQMAALPAGAGMSPLHLAGLLLTAGGMAAGSLCLFRRRTEGEGADL